MRVDHSSLGRVWPYMRRKSRLNEDICLQTRRGGISLNNIRQPGTSDHGSRLRIKYLILPKEAIPCPESLKLVCDNRLECRADDRAGGMFLRQAAHKQVNIVDTAVNDLKVTLQNTDHSSTARTFSIG